MKKIKVGLVGCGNISDIYLANSKKYDILEIAAVCDVVKERAEKQAEKYNIGKIYDNIEDIMKDDDIDVILNLTNPGSHYAVSDLALKSGKHVYTEKSLAINTEEGKDLVETAREKRLRIGAAPDTFLGGRLQTCRKLIDDGWIGKPVAAAAFMTCHGHEIWHPGPQFFYKIGAGPMFDMGPYYVTALLALLGNAYRVCGAVQTTFEKRLISSEPCCGELIDVEVPTHISGTIEFEIGTIATVVTSFDVWDSHLPRLEIYGTEGTISLPDADPLAGPNLFEGPILFRRFNESDWNGFPNELPRKEATPWREIPTLFGYNENSRIVGLADMCAAINYNRPHRANGDMALHALEIMEGIHQAAETGIYHVMQSKFEQPTPMPFNQTEYVFDE